MRLLTIHQPWAWLICAGHKRFENRTWATGYRGPLLIHAGKSVESLRVGTELCQRLEITLPDRLDFGAVIGTVNLTDCTPADGIDDPFAAGPYCFHLDSPFLFDSPIPWRGALGLVDPSDELIQAISRSASVESILAPQ